MNARDFALRGWVREHHNRKPGAAAWFKDRRHRWLRRMARRWLRQVKEEAA